jgi:hypothetical protein
MKPHVYYLYHAWWCHARPYEGGPMGMSCIGGPVDAYKDWERKIEADQP